MNAGSRRGAPGADPSLAKLMDFLESKGIPYYYSEEEGYVRIYFVDVFEAMGIEWRGREWDEIAGVLTDLAAEIERETGWRRDDENWEEQTDGWIFIAGAEGGDAE